MNDNESLEEPLLDLSEPLIPIPVPQFGHGQESNGPNGANVMDPDHDLFPDSLLEDSRQLENERERDQEHRNQSVLLRILGRDYAFSKTFWYHSVPGAILLGSVLGLTTPIFVGLVSKSLTVWTHSDQNGDGINIHSKGDWNWIGTTTLGAFLSALLLVLFHWAPSPGSCRNVFHDVSQLKSNPTEFPFVVVSCWLALASGAPLGPEMALASMGSGLATVLGKMLKVDRRTEALLVSGGLAGSLGGLFPSPLLGTILFHELSVIGRPVDLVVDSLMAAELAIPRDAIGNCDHDFMEQVTIAGLAATSAFVVLNALTHALGYEWHETVDLGSDTCLLWHLVAAVPLGAVCGIAGSLSLVLNGIFQQIRAGTTDLLCKYKVPKLLPRLFFPTLAGALHGLLAVYNPYLIGNGVNFIQLLAQSKDTVPSSWFLLTALLKILSMSMCLGFGLIGGPVVPMVFVGLCLGMAATTLSGLPLGTAVPACICATVGSFVPIPFTIILTVTFIMNLSAEQSGPPLVATFTAFLLTGGLGILKKLGESRLAVLAPRRARSGGRREEHSNPGMMVDEDESDDEELVRQIRSAIFGTNFTPLPPPTQIGG